mmetsp:Transcript_674/g.1213  ORF Transcript_674/g.1213 Transcript_674/m.1213 type:complete len:393 (+) Transcript_674:28-1206(+)
MEEQKVQLQPHVTLLIIKNEARRFFKFKVHNSSDKVLKFKFIFTSLTALKAKDKKKVTVAPGKVKTLLKAHIIGDNPAFQYAHKFKWLEPKTRSFVDVNQDLKLVVIKDLEHGKESFEVENTGTVAYNFHFVLNEVANFTARDRRSDWAVVVKPRKSAFIVTGNFTGEYSYNYTYEFTPLPPKQAKVRLHYFNVMNRAEFIRWLLVAKKVEFDDIRYTMEEWPAKKASFEFGKVPALEIDGEVLVTAISIGRYLAMKFKLYPEDPDQIYQVESLIDFISDIANFFDNLFFVQHNPEAWDKWLKTEGISKLKIVQTKLSENRSGAGPFVGKYMTLLDFYAAAFLHIHFFNPGQESRLAILARELPLLKAFVERFLLSSKRVAKYIVSRPQSFV